MPSRELFWNINEAFLIYPLFAIALAFLIFGMIRLIRKWHKGVAENRCNSIWRRLGNVITQSLGQKRILRDALPGTMHALIAWSFLVLTITTLVVAVQLYFGLAIFAGNSYFFFKVLANTAGLVMLIGLFVFLVRRLRRPDYLSQASDDIWVLVILLVILATGFIIQAIRMVITDDPYGHFGYVSWVMTPLFKAMFTPVALTALHSILWWFHFLLAMFFIAWLPYSKLAHIILGPAGQFLFNDGPKGVPSLIDFEDEAAESFGKSSLKEFSWKTWFDADACVRCGRCQQNCPAHKSGKNLNPRTTIASIKELACLNNETTLPGIVVSEEDIWACTTCRSCEEQCPLFIEQVNLLIEMRRWLVLTESRFPKELQQLFRNLENNGNAWGMGLTLREVQYDEMGLENQEHPEILLWPGCSAAFDMRNQEVLKAFIQLLKQAGVRYTALGNSERCCGDPARRLGNEYLFTTLATENIENIKATGIRQLVTTCPHCLHMLKDEYPTLGSDFSIVHHSQYLAELIKTTRLELSMKTTRIILQDSCYLGRYCGEYDAPRSILESAGVSIVEPVHKREQSVCCGAGGGRMWLEEIEGKRVSKQCLAELTPAEVPIVTVCPYCLTMLNDELITCDEKREIMDIAEVLV